MKLTKRLLSMLLVLCMVFSVLPAMGLPASAAETTIASWGQIYMAANTAYSASSYAGATAPKMTSDKPLTSKASSGSYCYYGSSSGGATITISDLPSGYKITSISFYARASKGGTMAVSYSTDGGSTYTSAGSSSTLTTSGGGTKYTVSFSASPTDVTDIKLVHSATTGSFYFGTVEVLGEATVATTKYSVTVDNTVTGGSISADKAEAAEGEAVTLTATPADGYLFSDWHVTTDETNTEVSVTNNQFTLPAEDVTVSAEFAAKTAATLTYSENGATHNPSGTYYVGDNVTLEDAAYEDPANYTFMGWLPSAHTDGTEPDDLLKVGDSYTLSAADNTLYAVYAIAGEGGGDSSSFDLVTSASDLVSGGKYILVGYTSEGNYWAATETLTSGYLKGEQVDAPTGSTIKLGTGNAVAVFTLGGAEGAWTLTNGSGALGGNAADKVMYNGNYTEWTISIGTNTSTTTGGASITNNYYTSGSTTSKLFYNYNNGTTPRFKTYTSSSMITPNLYKQQVGTTYTGWTTSPDTAPVTKYTITVTPTEGGTITPNLSEAIAGATVTLTITPDEGYKLKALTVKGADNSVIAVTDNTFTMPGQNVTVTATFEKLPTYTVTFYLKDGASAAKSVEVTEGSPLADDDFPTVTADEGFAFLGWYNGSYASAAAPAFFDKNTPITGNIDLYAVYGEENETKYALVTDLSQLYDGQKIVVYNPANTVALSSADAANANYRAGVDVSPVDGVLTITEADAAIVWTLGKNGGQYTFAKNGSFLTMGTETSGSRSLTLGDSVDYWTLASSSAANAYLVNSVSNSGAALEYYSGKWCGYTKADSAAFQTQFYVPQIIEYTTNPVVVPSHTVTWYNGDAVFQTTEVKEGRQIVKPDGTPTRDDDGETYYIFDGWAATKDGNAVTEFPLMGSEDMQYFAVFTSDTYAFTAQITGKDSIRAGKSANLTATLSSTPVKGDYSAYTATWNSSAPGIATVDENGLVTGVALGEAVITVIYKNADGTEIATATKTITVVENTSTGGYTLITQDMEDWSGEYVIVGRASGKLEDLNELQIFTPDIENGKIAEANGETTNDFTGWNASLLTLTPDTTDPKSAKGIISFDGNPENLPPYDYEAYVEMSSTGMNNVTAADGTEYTVYDRIDSIDDSFVFVIELVDDVNGYYTIRVKGTNIYLANESAEAKGNNGFDFVLGTTTDETPLWTIRMGTAADGIVTTDGYTPPIPLIESVYTKNNAAEGVERRILFNSQGWKGTSDNSGTRPDGSTSRFRVYGSSATDGMIGKAAYGSGVAYSVFLYGNPNPFYAQIRYNGEVKTIVDPVEVPAGRTVPVDLESVLLPDILNVPGYELVGDPVWQISDQSTTNNGSQIQLTATGKDDGTFSIGDATSGAYAIVTVTYTVRDVNNGTTYTISTDAKIVITDGSQSFSGVIYSGTEAAPVLANTTIFNGVVSVTLDYYVVDNLNGNTSLQENPGFSVDASRDVSLQWTAIGKGGTNYNVTYDSENGVWNVDTSAAAAGEIITVTMSGAGAKLDSNQDYADIANEPTYKIYVVSASLTADSLVIDFSLPVKFDPRANDTGHEEEIVSGIGTTTTVGTATSITIEGAGTATLDGNEITFTPTAILSKPVIFYYYIGDLVGTIRVIPATNVYYEDSFGGDVFTFTPETAWTTAGETINNALQNADFVGANDNNVYGYDAAYDACAQYSMGSAHIATVGETTNKATVQFSFYGTGFDVISLTGGNSGCLLVDVYSGTETEGTDVKPVRAYFVDTYYGYDSDGNVISDSPNFYQIPVMKIDGLEYGQYTAVITAYYHPLLNHAKDESYQFVFDAVRIYDPCGSNATANEAYQSDGEANAHYISLRDALEAGVAPVPTTYTATFVVPEGVTAPSDQTGVTTATMPTVDVPDLKYTFVGWVGQQVDNADTKPENVYAPDSEVPLTADTTFYALYSYSKTTGGGGDWTLVTDASTLKAGDQLLIASKAENAEGFVAGDISDSVMGSIETSFASDYSTVTKPAGAVVLTLGGSSGAWTLTNADGQLLGATAVKKLAWDSGTTTWRISISDNDATIQNGTDTYGRLLYNTGSPRFTTYTSATSTSMLLPQLYRQSGSGTPTTCYTTVISNSTVVTYTINLAADTTSIAVGGKANLTATLYADGVEVADAVPTWRNTQDSVATIVQNANLCTVTGVADGTTQVYATFTLQDGSTKEAFVTITVSSTSAGDQPASYSKTSNSGTRGVTCTTLDGTYADSYYVGSYTYANLSSQTGSTLLNSLRTLMTDSHSKTTSYDDCRDYAYKTDCQNEDGTVVLLYTSYAAKQSDFSGSAPGWNREHVWPKALGNGTETGPGADLHHVRPDDVTTNSKRGNKKFGVVTNGTEATGSTLVNGMSGGRYTDDYFEPLDNVKGDVARICLYLYVRYGGTISQYGNITNVFQSEDILLEWCRLDPVDTWEMGRNVVVANIQGNRNVFIDYPELAWLIFGKQVPSGMTTPSGNAASTTSADSTASVAAAAVPYEFTAKAAGTPVNSNVVFIDGNGAATLEEYLKNGPANEVYLAPGQAIAFNVGFEATPASIQLGMKTIAGGTANVNVTCGGSKDFSIATATEMYYDITDCVTLSSNTTTTPIVITNNSDVDVLLSVTNLKWTTADSTATGAKTAVFMTPESAQEALRVVDSVLGNTSEPEEPIDPADPIDPDDPDEPVEPAVKPEQFKDLDKNAWYYDGVVYAIENGLMNGVALDAFAPDGTLTRAMLVTALYRQAGSPTVEKNAEIPFTDVARGLWYTDAIIWANQEGIALGNSATTFAPDDPVTREQMVTFLWRFAGKKDSGQTLAAFADANTVADYAELPMKWAVENGIINGDNGKLLPQDTATRAQIANIFMRYEKSLALSE